MNEINTWFNSMDRLVSISLSSLIIYVALIAMTRLSGKRTTSQMNNFDWVITVAIGGLVSSGILLKNVAITDALVAMAALMIFQWLTTCLVIKNEIFRKLVKAKPALLLCKGELLRGNMKKERVSEAEIKAALRDRGLHSIDDAEWVILETDASFSVIARQDQELPDDPGLLSDVARH